MEIFVKIDHKALCGKTWKQKVRNPWLIDAEPWKTERKFFCRHTQHILNIPQNQGNDVYRHSLQSFALNFSVSRETVDEVVNSFKIEPKSGILCWRNSCLASLKCFMKKVMDNTEVFWFLVSTEGLYWKIHIKVFSNLPVLEN